MSFVARHPWAGIAFVVLLTGAATACGTGDAGGSAPAVLLTQPAGPPGAATYERSCARCHGASLEGKEDAPALDQVRLATLGDQRLRMTIQYGKGRMRGFGGLTTQEVDDLVAYLKTV